MAHYQNPQVGDVLAVKSWGQRKEPDVGAVITQNEFGNWSDRRPRQPDEIEGVYLGDGEVKITRVPVKGD